jgi:hypothetical protein
VPDFEETARCLYTDRVASSVLIIKQLVRRYERERRVRVVIYDDYLAATGRGVSGGLIAPIDWHWFEAWMVVRAKLRGGQGSRQGNPH